MGRSRSRSSTESRRQGDGKDRRRSDKDSSARKRSRSRDRHEFRRPDYGRGGREGRGRREDGSTSSSSSSSSRVQRGIDAAKNRLRASLSSAINEFKSKEQASHRKAVTEEKEYDFSSSLSVFDSLNRQKTIEEIDNDSYFTSERFNSSASQSKPSVYDDDVKTHDRAMFGAMWMSKEIEKKMANKSNNRSAKK